MLQRADSLGVFQVESRAQMSMLPRLRPKEFYDLVIEVAIVRPGPIQGDMVHPYLRRRQGLEKVDYPSEALRAVLEKTLGVPLFQEQAMKIAIVAGGFTPSEADKLRRAMATFRRTGTIGTFRQKMIDGMAARGYAREFAERCFHQIEGFGEYGFPESHAASFALLVYASAWLKCRYPDVFAAALLNSQPMGFYAPAQIVRDAREHGVELRAVDINHSDWDAALEPGPRAAERLHSFHREMASDIWSDHALRLGFRSVKGMREEDAQLISTRRGAGYDSIRDLWLRTGLAPAMIARLAGADAFRSLGLSRRDALWVTRGLGRAGDKDDLPLFASIEPGIHTREPDVHLPPMPPGEEVVHDYRALQLSLKAHPVSFLRGELKRMGVVENEALYTIRKDARVTVSGLVLVRQRPGSANGVIFATLEDETTIANLIIWPSVFERFRPVVLGARLLIASGRLQRETEVIHVVVDEVRDATPLLARLAEGPPIEAAGPCDEVKRPVEDDPRSLLHKRGVRRQLAALIAEEPSLAADLDRPAHGTHHRRTRSGRPRAAHPPAPPDPPAASRTMWPKGRNFH
jgi:error-prone DNA polymerase